MGGTGAMGSHLVGILAADPANELTVTTRKEFPSVENGCIRYVRGNAHDIGFVRSLVPVGAKWDCIVDFMVIRPTNSGSAWISCCRYANNMFF